MEISRINSPILVSQNQSMVLTPSILLDEEAKNGHFICESDFPEISAHKEVSPSFRI